MADHRSLLTLRDMTVICRGENKENGGEREKKRKETDVFSSWARVWQVLV